MKKGDKVILTKLLKGLPENSIGVIYSVNHIFAVIIYPQFLPTLKEKGYVFSNYIYSHSANLKDLKYEIEE